MDLPLSYDLLNYYRQRIEKSEQDYQDALEYLDKIKVSHKEYHELAWTLHQRNQEVASLQQAVSDAQAQVFEERKQLLKSLAENDELRLQELRDRKKVRYLLATHGFPDEDETTYFKDELEKRFVRRPHSSDHTAARKAGRTSGSAGQQHRDAYYDNLEMIDGEDAETLRLRCKAMKAQLDEQRQMYENQVAALKQDRDTIIEENEVRRRDDAERIEDLLEKAKKFQEFSRENTRELLEFKKAQRIQERRNAEEKVKLRDEVQNLKSRFGKEKGRNDNMEKHVEDRISRKSEILISELRQNLTRTEGLLEEERQRNSDTQHQSKRQADAIQQRLDLATKELKTFKKRRQAEIEGYTNEIQILKKELKKQEKQNTKSIQLEDREHEYLKFAQQTGRRASKLSGALHDIKARVYEAERKLHGLTF